MSSAEDWYQLLATIEQLPHREQLTACEQALRDAERAQQPLGAVIMRQGLIDAALNLGRGDLIVQHFPRCLAEMPADQPALQRDILFRYRWAVASIIEFPQVTLEQIDELVADMSQRYLEAGYSLRGVEVLKMLVGRETGRQPLAVAAQAKFATQGIDELSDDEETERAFVARNHAMFGNAIEAVADARRPYPSSYHRVIVYSTVLQLLLRHGEQQLAAICARQSRAGVTRDVRFARERGEHLLYYGVTGQVRPAHRLLGDHFGEAWQRFEQIDRFWYLRGAGFFLQRTAGRGPLSIACRLTMDGQRISSRNRSQLAQWSLAEAQQIATQLDQRNGNAYFQQWIDELPALHDLADQLS